MSSAKKLAMQKASSQHGMPPPPGAPQSSQLLTHVDDPHKSIEELFKQARAAKSDQNLKEHILRPERTYTQKKATKVCWIALLQLLLQFLNLIFSLAVLLNNIRACELVIQNFADWKLD